MKIWKNGTYRHETVKKYRERLGEQMYVYISQRLTTPRVGLELSFGQSSTYDLAVNPPSADRKAHKPIVFRILASFWIFARVRILSHFFARYRGIGMPKRYETV